MLFSQPDLAEHMSANFECSWEGVAPVPRVRIEFGNGHTLDRTLHGNIATWLCTPDGEVFDVIPGIVDPETYRMRLDEALLSYQLLKSEPDPASVVARLNLERAQRLEGLRAMAEDERRALEQAEALEARLGIVSKQAIEAPLETALGSRPIGELDVRRDFLPQMSTSKRQLERPVEDMLGEQASLYQDARNNALYRDPLAARLIAASPLVPPQALTRQLYRDVLDIDLDDPYMGLAPLVLGAELGRQAPEEPTASVK